MVGTVSPPTTPSFDAPVSPQADASSPPITETGPALTPSPDAVISPPTDTRATIVDAVTNPPDRPAMAPDASVSVPDAPAPPPTSLGPTIRAKEILADTVVARVIYVKEIDVQEAKIDTLTETKDDKRWEMGGADIKIDTERLQAETIYVEKLHCRRVEAQQVFAEVVKIQRP